MALVGASCAFLLIFGLGALTNLTPLTPTALTPSFDTSTKLTLTVCLSWL